MYALYIIRCVHGRIFETAQMCLNLYVSWNVQPDGHLVNASDIAFFSDGDNTGPIKLQY
jgi:hypothetical protein